MSFLYTLFYFIGYFFIFIVLSTIAIIFAHKKFSWLIYLIGAIITLFSLVGNQTSFNNYLTSESMGMHWAIYVVGVIFVAVIIYIRHGLASEKAEKQKLDNHKEKIAIKKDDNSIENHSTQIDI